MIPYINTAVIFAFGLLVSGIVMLGIMQARDQAAQVARAGRGPSHRRTHAVPYNLRGCGTWQPALLRRP